MRLAPLPFLMLLSGCTRALETSDLGGIERDAATADLSSAGDLAGPRDLAEAAFPVVLDGVWLIGWPGGLDHFSWVRFQGGAMWRGRLDVLDPVGMRTFVGYWPGCVGTGKWFVTQKRDTVWLDLPAGCATANAVLTFESVGPPPAWPTGARLEAQITALGPNGDQRLLGWKFSAEVCDPGFTKCQLP